MIMQRVFVNGLFKFEQPMKFETSVELQHRLAAGIDAPYAGRSVKVQETIVKERPRVRFEDEDEE